MRLHRALLFGGLLAVASVGRAQTPPAPRFEGTLVMMAGTAEMEVGNDEALVSFYFEVQEAELTRAQSLLNQRVAEGVAALKRADPKALVETTGYGAYPVYQTGSARKIIGWRARQGVSVRTAELDTLPRTVAAGQQQLALGGIGFRLSQRAREHVEGELIQRSMANLSARVAAAAQALGVPAARVRIEEMNFGVPVAERPPMIAAARMSGLASSPDAVPEPQLDAGRSTQHVTVSAKVRFLAP
jgi:predicted secreted protein